MKKTLLLLFVLAVGYSTSAQDLSKCKKTCIQDKLIEHGAFLGVKIQTAENSQHAKILQILPNTSAERNHLAVNDKLTKFEGSTIKNHQHLIQMIRAHKPHDIVKIEYIHNGKTKKKRVELGAYYTKTIQEFVCCDEVESPTPQAKETKSIVPAEARFILYPNPAVNDLQITSDLQLSGTIEIGIFDMLGNQLLSEKVEANEQMLNQTINLKSFATGTYLVKIKNKDTEAVNKLVITK